MGAEGVAMPRVGATWTRDHLAEVLRRAEAGEVFEVEHAPSRYPTGRRVVAIIGPPADEDGWELTRDELADLFPYARASGAPEAASLAEVTRRPAQPGEPTHAATEGSEDAG